MSGRWSACMIVESNETKGDLFYEEFYKKGGWSYSYWREYWWHRKQIVKRFGLRRGMSLLDAGCGNGFHTHLFKRMGFQSVGVDRSRAGIEWAKKHYPETIYHCCDLFDMPFAHNSFDVVLARGLSHYHYNLAGRKAITATAELLRFVKPGGLFSLVIITDLSGRKPVDDVWQNTLADYRKHMSLFSDEYQVDWYKGMAICSCRKEAEPVGAQTTREISIVGD